MEYLNYFTLLHVVVIAGLCVMLYQQYVLTLVREVMSVLFECIREMSVGRPVRIIENSDGSIDFTFPGRDVEEDESDGDYY